MANPAIDSAKLNSNRSNDVSVLTASDRNKSDVKGLIVATNKHTTSETLFAGARELVIEHAGDVYRLRLTNLGKLILTK